MKLNYLLKVCTWSLAGLLTLSALVLGLWFHPLITLAVLIVGWFMLMRYLDPPEKWDL